MLSQSVWAALGPFVVHARTQLLHVLDAHAYSLIFDGIFALFFGLLAATLWCCCLRSAQDVTLALLKIFAYVALGAVASNIALHIVSISAHENRQVSAALNSTMTSLAAHLQTLHGFWSLPSPATYNA